MCSVYRSMCVCLYVPFILLTQLLYPQTVNVRKLEKAEAKLKAKQEKRTEKDTQKVVGNV